MIDSSTGPRENPPRTKQLLLVDDNLEGRRALARLMEFYGFAVTAVGNAAEALAILAQSPPPDVLMTDLLLPDMDGREIARVADRTVPRPLVIVITGWDFGQDPDERAQWGIDHVFYKPINMAELVATVSGNDPPTASKSSP